MGNGVSNADYSIFSLCPSSDYQTWLLIQEKQCFMQQELQLFPDILLLAKRYYALGKGHIDGLENFI